ncbi:cache domain-containing protein [Deefgea rivuli]|uniref:cache domain-containing protein n=1 Tax=Deefgea rivuli TaxID=400948 RepID=UPI00068776AF|nr:hypothetical protein [Deefgea rivuli]
MCNRLTLLLVTYRKLTGLAILCLSIGMALCTAFILREQSEIQQQKLLEIAAQRAAVELLAQTLSSNLMGSVAMLGLIDTRIQTEAARGLGVASPEINILFERVGQTLGVDGVFLVSASGKVASAWDNSGKSSTGVDVAFRPYFQMAMKGQDSVYAAVSLARGDRSLYFSAPVFVNTATGHQAVGAMVARSGIFKVDELLQRKADIALLLSPQGVVFASNHKEWIGYLAEAATPEQLHAIRELRQFGAMFAQKDPKILAIPIASGVQQTATGRYAVSRAPVQWNDPFGDWQLVLLEDLERSVPLSNFLAPALFVGFLVLLLGSGGQYVLINWHVKGMANAKLAEFAQLQQADAARKNQIAAATLKLQQYISVDEQLSYYLSELHHMLGMTQGVVYLSTETKDELVLAGSFACDPLPNHTLHLGEGLLGQCALDYLPRVELLATSGLGMLRSGLGEIQPAALLLAPLLLNHSLVGVVEIAMLTPPDAAQQELFSQLNTLLALNLTIARRNLSTQTACAPSSHTAQTE